MGNAAAFSGGAYLRMKQGPPTCFAAGTMILTAAGLAAIENIKAGDKVISTNPDTFETEEKTVLETYVREVRRLVHLTVGGELISTTADHPFYVKGRDFVNAGELQAGDELVDAAGAICPVENIRVEIVETLEKVYNFQVEEFHTYRVGNRGVLVHNAEYGVEGGTVPEGGTTAKGLTGHDFEDYLTNNIGGNGSFCAGGREFDGGTGSRWWEAKSGNYWKMLEENPNKLAKFKSDMGDRLRIATENGVFYELFSNTPIPESIKQWLTKKGIPFTELLD